MTEYLYVWRWNPQMQIPGMDHPMTGRKGQPCRVLVRGKRNSALIEFRDGFTAVVSRNGLRRAK